MGRVLRTVEEVEEALGFDPKRPHHHLFGSGCGYNLDRDDDSAHDCNMPARWHVRCRGEGTDYMMLACDRHVGRILGGHYAEALKAYHEVGSACGLEGTWWIDQEGDCGSLCVTEERGVELGFLKYV